MKHLATVAVDGRFYTEESFSDESPIEYLSAVRDRSRDGIAWWTAALILWLPIDESTSTNQQTENECSTK